MSKDKPVSARFSRESYKQLMALCKAWGENASQALARAVQLAFTAQQCKDKKEVKPEDK